MILGEKYKRVDGEPLKKGCQDAMFCGRTLAGMLRFRKAGGAVFEANPGKYIKVSIPDVKFVSAAWQQNAYRRK